MKKILSLSVMALLLMGLVGGGTWAYFSDTETASGGGLTAGTLDLGLDTTANQSPTGSITDLNTKTDWAPGADYTISFYVNNEGTIPMSGVIMELDLGTQTGTTLTSVDQHDPLNATTDVLKEMVKITDITFGGSTISGFAEKTLAELDGASGFKYNLGELAADTEKKIEIEFTFDSTATNGCQGIGYPFTLTFTGYQHSSQLP